MLKKIVIGLTAFFILIVIALVSIPFLFKDKINAKLKEQVNSQLNAKVDYGDFSISLIHSFPNFNLSLNDLSIVCIHEFKGDTLVYIKNFSFTVDLMSVIEGKQYKLLALNIVEPSVHAQVNYDGKTNWDIMKPSVGEGGGESSNSGFSMQIKKYKIEKGKIIYEDKQENSFSSINDLDFEGSGDVTSDLYDFATKTSIAELTYKSGAVPYLNKAKLNADIHLSVDNRNNKYTFKENSISLNNLGLQFDGSVTMPKEGMDLDLKFKSKQTEFRSILSLIPAVYKKDFDKLKTSGSLSLDGSVKGFYKDSIYPALNLNLSVNNGMFQYPDLPVAVRNIFIVSNISKPQGFLDLTSIDVSKLHFEAGNDPVDGKINIKTPISNPDITANFTGKVDLANVPKFYPMEGLETISGIMNINLDFKAKKSDVDKKNYSAIHAAGSLKIANMVYDTKTTPMPIRIPDLQMTFSPKNVTLNSFSAVIGKSDINATGTLDNFMAYFFGKGDLVGSINLKSTVFDANEWLRKDKSPTASASSSKTADTAKTEYFKVPAHVDLIANSQFGKVYYDKLMLENVKGQVTIKNEAINLNNLSASLLGGNANFSAAYDTWKTDHPNISFSYDIKNFDIQKTYAASDMAGKMAPVIKYIQGNFSSNMKGSGKLKPDMSVDYSSLLGDGKVEIPQAKIVDLPALAEISKLAKIPALQNLELKNAWTVLKFKNGRVNVDPTDLKFGNGYNVHLEGSNGFDQSVDYDMRMDVPTKELGSATTLAQNFLSKIPGLGNAVPQTIGFLFKVTGTAAKPQVKLNKIIPGAVSGKDAANSATEDLKKKADEQLQKQKQEMEKKAKEEADKLKKQAEDKLKDVFKFPH